MTLILSYPSLHVHYLTPLIFSSNVLFHFMTLTRSQLRPRSDLGLVNKPTGSTSRPPHAPSTPSRSTTIDTLPSHTVRPHIILLTLAIRLRALDEGSRSPPLLFAEALHTHHESLHRYASTSFPTVCDTSLRPPTFAVFPSTRPSPSYSGPRFSPSLKPASLPSITFLT